MNIEKLQDARCKVQGAGLLRPVVIRASARLYPQTPQGGLNLRMI